MSDYKELLDLSSRIVSPPISFVSELADALRAVIAERDATESERKHWEMTADALRTDLECMTRRAEQAEARLADAEDALQKIVDWSEAYPLSVFPEPDFKKANEVLKANGMTLDAISASNMRHVVKGVGEIARATIRKGET